MALDRSYRLDDTNAFDISNCSTSVPSRIHELLVLLVRPFGVEKRRLEVGGKVARPWRNTGLRDNESISLIGLITA